MARGLRVFVVLLAIENCGNDEKLFKPEPKQPMSNIVSHEIDQLFDNDQSLREARHGFPLGRVLESFGHGPTNGKWKSFTCPFCRKKNKAGLFELEGVELFRCRSTSCQSGARAMDAVAYLAYMHGRNRRDAFEDYLRMAGVWKEHEIRRSTSNSNNLPAAQAGVEPAALTDDTSEGHGPGSQRSQFNDGDYPTRDTSGQTAAPPAGDIPPAAATTSLDTNPAEVVPAAGQAASLSEVPSSSVARARESLPSEAECRIALRIFHDRLQLTEAHELELFEKRSISSETSRRLGFRSSVSANRAILLQMASEYPMPVLVAAGLWGRAPVSEGGPWKPSAQYFGWGRTGKKIEGEDEWTWTNPILIPYFDVTGELLSLRPHKSGISSGKKFSTGRTRERDRCVIMVSPHLYVPRDCAQAAQARAGGPPDTRVFEDVILTEGEFKAAALTDQDRLPAGWWAASLPGIQTVNTYQVWSELESWLRLVKARRVLIVYDNEDKQRIKDPLKRHAAKIWARILSRKLAAAIHLKVEIGLLPAELRDPDGKADWDSCFKKVRMQNAE